MKNIELNEYKIRPLTDNDKYKMAEYANNFDIWINLAESFPRPYKLSDAEKFIQYCKINDNNFNLCIDFQGEFIGMIGISYHKEKPIEFGYWLAQDFWGKGIMTKCCREFLKNLFSTTQINEILSRVYEYNKESMNVLKKLGFLYIEKNKKAILKNNMLVDEYKFILTKENFLSQTNNNI